MPMPADYHKLYLTLFNAQTNAIQVLDSTSEMLKKVHLDVEEAIMEAPDTAITVLKRPDETDKKED